MLCPYREIFSRFSLTITRWLFTSTIRRSEPGKPHHSRGRHLMGDGPRDWNPPGYWDSTRSVSSKQSNWRQVRAPKSQRTAIVLGIIAILLGLFACWWPLSLPSANGGYRGFAFTTLGLTTAALAYRALQFRGWAPRIGKALPFTGFSLGLIGTVLCIWSLASFYDPQVVPALPSFNPSATGQSLTSPYPPIALAPGAASSRVVAPIDGADTAAPTQQLHANLKHVAITGDTVHL